MGILKKRYPRIPGLATQHWNDQSINLFSQLCNNNCEKKMRWWRLARWLLFLANS